MKAGSITHGSGFRLGAVPGLSGLRTCDLEYGTSGLKGLRTDGSGYGVWTGVYGSRYPSNI